MVSIWNWILIDIYHRRSRVHNKFMHESKSTHHNPLASWKHCVTWLSIVIYVEPPIVPPTPHTVANIWPAILPTSEFYDIHRWMCAIGRWCRDQGNGMIAMGQQLSWYDLCASMTSTQIIMSPKCHCMRPMQRQSHRIGHCHLWMDANGTAPAVDRRERRMQRLKWRGKNGENYLLVFLVWIMALEKVRIGLVWIFRCFHFKYS